MTVHIALANAAAALLASDSQGADDTSEFHGWQKQFAGPDFLVGVAGSGLVLDELFGRLQEAIQPGVHQLTAAGVQGYVENFVIQEMQPDARSQVEFILVTPPAADGAVRTYRPDVFTHMGRLSRRGFIGSGSDFVVRASSRYSQLGIVLPDAELADLVVAFEDYARAADESLTVDDSFMLGIVTNGKSYLMGDRRIDLDYAPDPLISLNWPQAATWFEDIMDAARAVNSELENVQQELSAIRTGGLTAANVAAIQAINGVIATGRQSLIQHLQDFFVWYDGLLGRP